METGPALAMAQGSSKSSPLRWVTAGSPTNYNMLLFRTLNRELQQPNANQDTLAALFRDKLMPLRMWWLKRMPGALKRFKQVLEHKKHGVPGCLNFVDARTSWFDGVVKDALSKHGISQVVVVAAGFDTRAYRIGAKYKGVTFFEVDLPHASKKKQQLVEDLLQPEATFPRPTFLAADLSQQPLDTVLLSAAAKAAPASAPADSAGKKAAAAAGSEASQGPKGFDPSKPTLFTVEGLIYYLPDEAVRGLFGALLRVAAPGSRVAFDFLNKQVLEGSVAMPPAYRVTATSVANKGEPFISGIHDSREAVQAFLNSVSAPSPVSHAAQATPTASPAAPARADLVEAGKAAESDTTAAAGAGGAGVKLRWEVVDYLGPKEMVSQQLPHLAWDDELPPILSFYSFASAQVVAA